MLKLSSCMHRSMQFQRALPLSHSPTSSQRGDIGSRPTKPLHAGNDSLPAQTLSTSHGESTCYTSKVNFAGTENLDHDDRGVRLLSQGFIRILCLNRLCDTHDMVHHLLRESCSCNLTYLEGQIRLETELASTVLNGVGD